MGESTQQVLATAMVVVAAVWLVVRWRRRRAKNCDTCAIAEAARTAPLAGGAPAGKPDGDGASD